MKAFFGIGVLVLTGCALTPEQQEAMRSTGVAISQAVEEHDQQQAVIAASRPQYVPPPLALPGGPMNPFSPTIKVTPVNQFGFPIQ